MLSDDYISLLIALLNKMVLPHALFQACLDKAGGFNRFLFQVPIIGI